MAGVSVMGLLISYSAQYVILFFLTQSDVGFYSLGFRLSDTVLSNITMIILIVMTPAVMKAYDEDAASGPIRGADLIRRLVSLDLWAILPVCMLLAFYAGDIVRLLFPSYLGAEEIVVLLLISAVLRSVSMITCKALELVRRTRSLFLILLVSMALNVAYLFAFVPVYGISAAGHGSILAYLIYNILILIRSRRYIRITIDYRYVATVLCTSAFVLLVAALLSALLPVKSVLLLCIEGATCVGLYLVVSVRLGLTRALGRSY